MYHRAKNAVLIGFLLFVSLVSSSAFGQSSIDNYASPSSSSKWYYAGLLGPAFLSGKSFSNGVTTDNWPDYTNAGVMLSGLAGYNINHLFSAQAQLYYFNAGLNSSGEDNWGDGSASMTSIFANLRYTFDKRFNTAKVFLDAGLGTTLPMGALKNHLSDNHLSAHFGVGMLYPINEDYNLELTYQLFDIASQVDGSILPGATYYMPGKVHFIGLGIQFL